MSSQDFILYRHSNSSLYCTDGWRDFWIWYNIHVDVYITLVVCTLGSVTNIINLVVFSHSRMRRSSPLICILTALVTADLCSTVRRLTYNLVKYLSGRWDCLPYSQATYPWLFLDLTYGFFCMMFHSWAIYLTLVAALWRWMGVLNPLQSRQWNTMRNARRATLVAVLFGSAVSCLFVFCWEIQPVDNEAGQGTNLTSWTPTPTPHLIESVEEEDLYRAVLTLRGGVIFFLAYGVFLKVIPCLVLAVATGGLILSLMKMVKSRKSLFGAGSGQREGKKNGSKSSESSAGSGNSGNSNNSSNSCSNSNSSTSQTSVCRVPEDFSSSNSLHYHKRRSTHQMEGGVQERSNRTTCMLVVILVIFLVTEFPFGVTAVCAAILGKTFWYECGHVIMFVVMLEYISATASFPVYLCMSANYRHTFFLLANKFKGYFAFSRDFRNNCPDAEHPVTVESLAVISCHRKGSTNGQAAGQRRVSILPEYI